VFVTYKLTCNSCRCLVYCPLRRWWRRHVKKVGPRVSSVSRPVHHFRSSVAVAGGHGDRDVTSCRGRSRRRSMKEHSGQRSTSTTVKVGLLMDAYRLIDAWRIILHCSVDVQDKTGRMSTRWHEYSELNVRRVRPTPWCRPAGLQPSLRCVSQQQPD